MNRVKILTLLALLCAGLGSAYGQSVSLDHVDGLVSGDPGSILVGENVVFHIRMANPTTSTYIVFGSGFRVYSDNGAAWGTFAGQFVNGFETNFIQSYVNLFSNDGMGADTIGFAGLNFSPDAGITPGFEGVTFNISIGAFATSEHGKTVCLDSSFFPPGGSWKWTNPTETVYPSWDGPHCYQVFDPDAPLGNLVLTPTSLDFTAQQDSDNPAPQSFEVASDGAPLAFTLSESSSWLLLDRTSGTTPQDVEVSVNISSLAEGTYIDSVMVSSPGVANSPQWLVVTLEITPPPAEIGVSPTQFYFNAVAGSDNPAPQLLNISNLGGVPLNWTVSNTQSWLSLDPPSGVDDGIVTLNVDITGLAFDDYYDTIVVSDPGAINSPVLVPVNLSVGSDLPIIEVEYNSLYIIPLSELFVFSRGFAVNNGGAGTMNFTATSSASEIVDISVGSGTAPDSVTLTFDFKTANDGDEWEDTVWVASNEAINSPVAVPIRLRFVTEPAILELSHDTITFNVYQCYQGFGLLLPTAQLISYNVGGDDPLFADLTYDSDLFTVTVDAVEIPPVWDIRALTPTVDVGTYYDTLVVTAEKAINSPQIVIVVTNVLPRVEPPELMLLRDEITVYYNRNAEPTEYFGTVIVNRVGGCLDWFADESVTWLTPLPSEGTIPSNFSVRVGPTSLPNGWYRDSVLIAAPDATNAPLPFRVNMFLWEFRGDVNADGIIDMGDLTGLIKYVFLEGPSPLPLRSMGDVNCDGLVDIGDITYLIKYLFDNGPPPCTSPLTLAAA